MNKLFLVLICSTILFSSNYYGSTTATVVLAGGIIKAKHIQEVSVKHKRKDCPVCKGKGWYMSGDGILKIDCTYCEPDKASPASGKIMVGEIISIQPNVKSVLVNPKNCPNGNCPIPSNKR